MPPYTLAIFDIDGTLRRVADPWLHLHQHLQTAAAGEGYYRRWQNGEIDYHELCRLDSAMWRGATRKGILAALESNPLREGAVELVQWLRQRDIACVGLSTGLTVFHEITAAMLGLSEVRCNELLFEDELCAGEVVVRVTEDAKVAVMDSLLERFDCEAAQTLVFGDGRADIPILSRAGLSVAVFPRSQAVADAADYVVATEPISSIIPVLEQAFDKAMVNQV